MISDDQVLISVVIPCYNEVNYIGKCIDSLMTQEGIRDQLEILVVDGISNDGTREVIKDRQKKSDRVILVDNPQKITPVALNLGIKNSKGKYVCIMGAHAEYDSNYLNKCLKTFEEHPEVSCVGGPIRSKGKNSFAKAASTAMSSSIGVGNAKHRFPDYEGYAEMACFPMFRKEVFDQIGYYNEKLVKNQDDEFCFRLNQNGGKVYLNPNIRSEYYVRDTPGKLFNQYYNYGFWRIPVMMMYSKPISYRQLMPFFFFLTVFILIIVSAVTQQFWLGAVLPLFYLIILFTFGVREAVKQGIKMIYNFPAAVFTLHLSYAMGFINGIFRYKLFPQSTITK